MWSARTGSTVRRFIRPVEQFVRWESSSAFLLIAAAVAALVWANMSDSYGNLWDAHASLEVGPLHLDESLRHWVNDLLMAVFFFVVALEVKRELLFGSLSDRRSALVPAAAAFGTMIGAATVYLAVNRWATVTCGAGRSRSPPTSPSRSASSASRGAERPGSCGRSC